MLSCWRSRSQSVIVSLSHLVLICYFDELVVGGTPLRQQLHIHTHTHPEKPSPLISLMYCDMWLAANSILQFCTVTGSRMLRFGAQRLFHVHILVFHCHKDPHVFAGCKEIRATDARVLSHIFNPHVTVCLELASHFDLQPIKQCSCMSLCTACVV